MSIEHVCQLLCSYSLPCDLTQVDHTLRRSRLIQRRDRNENVKKKNINKRRLSGMHVHHTFFSFLYISLPFLHDYNVKMPNFTLYGECKQATTTFYFSFWTWI